MVGILEEVKFFIDWFPAKSKYLNNLKLQGSNDGTTYDDILTIGEDGTDIHEGWNYYELPTIFGDTYTLPKDRFIRLFNA